MRSRRPCEIVEFIKWYLQAYRPIHEVILAARGYGWREAACQKGLTTL